MTDTSQDHHHRPPGCFTFGTLELHQGGPGSVRGTAAAVCARATVARLVDLDAGAVLIGEVDGCIAPHHPLTPTACLQGETEPFTECMGTCMFLCM